MEPGASCGSCASRASCSQLNKPPSAARLRGLPLVITAAFTFIVPPITAIMGAGLLPVPGPVGGLVGLGLGVALGQVVNRQVQARIAK